MSDGPVRPASTPRDRRLEARHAVFDQVLQDPQADAMRKGLGEPLV
jgi:hypothetical protein